MEISHLGRPKSSFTPHSHKMVGTKDAAAILGISVSTIQKMVSDGRLSAWKTTGGHRRIDIEQLQRLAEQLHIPSPAGLSQLVSAQPQRNDPLRILIVEDNPMAIKALVRPLEQMGSRVEVTVTGDGAEALLHVARRRPDLMIIDLIMKPFDGFHLLRVLGNSSPGVDVPTLVVTGLSDEQISERGGINPRIPVYQKPLHPQRLQGFVEALLLTRKSY